MVIPTVANPPPKLGGKEIISEDYRSNALSLLSIASISGCCQVRFFPPFKTWIRLFYAILFYLLLYNKDQALSHLVRLDTWISQHRQALFKTKTTLPSCFPLPLFLVLLQVLPNHTLMNLKWYSDNHPFISGRNTIWILWQVSSFSVLDSPARWWSFSTGHTTDHVFNYPGAGWNCCWN